MSGQAAHVGTTVGGKYRVVRFIAEGGMGAVYEANHLFIRRRFAIKFLRRALAGRRDVLTRFKHEAQAAGGLEHENIAAVVDFGMSDDGTPYLVMEYLEGIDVAALLAQTGPLPSERAADLVRQAALGVEIAHQRAVIHRDLKPQNLFLCRRGDGTDLVKLLDFGVAKLESTASAVTRTGAMLGTPAYMAPEQARGEPDLDARTDVYALGVILYELLSGRKPHLGDTPNAVIHHIATEAALPLSREGSALPKQLVDLVQRSLGAQRDQRPASAARLAEELESFAERKPWPAPSLVSLDTQFGSQSTVPVAANPESEPSFTASLLDSRVRSRRGTARSSRWWFAAATLVPAAAFAVFALRHEPAPTPPAASSSRAIRPNTPAPRAVPAPAAASARAVPPKPLATSDTPSTTGQRSTVAPKRSDERPPTRTRERPRAVLPAVSAETGPAFDAENPYD